jgi:hypothetical protein
VVAAFQAEPAPYKAGKSTIRLPLSELVPVKSIQRIAKFRARELARREAAKTAAPKSRQAIPMARKA